MHQWFDESNDPEDAERIADMFHSHREMINQARSMHQAAMLLMTIGKEGKLHPEIAVPVQKQAKFMAEESQRIIHVARSVILDDMQMHGLEPFYSGGRIFFTRPVEISPKKAKSK